MSEVEDDRVSAAELEDAKVLLTHPRIEADRYVIYPKGYEDFVNSDRDAWCLTVANGRRWGWSISRGRGMGSGGMAMNRKGEFIWESRASGRNKPRRWPLREALTIALEHVDSIVLNGHTAAEASASVAARLATPADSTRAVGHE